MPASWHTTQTTPNEKTTHPRSQWRWWGRRSWGNCAAWGQSAWWSYSSPMIGLCSIHRKGHSSPPWRDCPKTTFHLTLEDTKTQNRHVFNDTFVIAEQPVISYCWKLACVMDECFWGDGRLYHSYRMARHNILKRKTKKLLTHQPRLYFVFTGKLICLHANDLLNIIMSPLPLWAC